jgi:DNA-directed RNA polymerase specialized sigma24 family protein
MELADIAEIAGFSVGTLKRRLGRAQALFVEAASRDSLLREHIASGSRWENP